MKQKQNATIEGLVRQVVTEYLCPKGINYMFLNWAQTNVEIDKVCGPTVVYILPASGTMTFNLMRRRIYDAPEAQIAVLIPTEFDFESDENDELIEVTKRIAMAFITAINSSGYFEKIDGELQYQVIYDYLDENVTGVMISPVLKEIVGLATCEEGEAGVTSIINSLFTEKRDE